MGKLASLILTTALIIGVVTSASMTRPTKAGIIIVPDDYPRIQEAINAASDMDTIFVKAGIYYENIVVNKTVSLIGEEKTTTIIDGNRTGECVKVVSDSVVINGFTIRNGSDYYSCVRLASNGNQIVNNDIKSGWCGVIINNHRYSNLIVNNTITDNLNGVVGEQIHSSKIIGNNIADNLLGIWIGPYSSGNTVSFNNVSRNWSEGISLWQSSYNLFEGNNLIDNNQCGWASSITIGFQQQFSMGNKFFHNNIIDNGHHIMLSGPQDTVTWDDGYPSGGNYWSSYKCSDEHSGCYQNETGHDGIGDHPYEIDQNNFDRYPLMHPWAPPDAAAVSIEASENLVGCGYSVNLALTIQNQGNKIERLNLRIYVNDTLILSENIMVGDREDLVCQIIFGTGGFPYGGCEIKLMVTTLKYETDTADNTCTYSGLTVTAPGDVNGDFHVQLDDLAILSNAYRSRAADSNWNPNADINNDGVVNLKDIVILARHYEHE